jgi:hypothetical protein
MSAVDNTPSSPTPDAAPQGPVEVVVGPAQTNLSEQPKDDVTDVVPKDVAKTPDPVADPASDDDDDDAPRDEKGRYRGVQHRIDELTRSRREAEREAEYWKARAGGTSQAQNPAQPSAGSQPPDPTAFKTQEEYIEALTDYKVEEKLAKKDAEHTHVKQVTDRAQLWQGKLEAARADTPDFDQVMNNADIAVANHVADLLLESDAGAKIAYHLAQNPDKLDKINGMTPAKVAIELGKLEASLSKPDVVSAEVKPDVKTSKAPPPARAIGQGRSTTPTLGEMPMEDYVKARKAQGASWAR